MSKKVLKNGNYRTLATVPIGDGEAIMLAEDFMAKVRQAQKILDIAAKKDADASISVSGVENTVLEKIAPVGEPEKSVLALDGLQDPALHLVVGLEQAQLDEELLQSKEDLLKNTLKKTILTGNRIAEELTNSTLDASDFSRMIAGSKDESSVRKVIANASQPRLAIHIEGESQLNSGGGLAVPRQLVKGDALNFSNCMVIDVSRRGWVKIRTQAIDGTEHVEKLEFHVDRKSKEFNLLNAARIFDCLVDCQLIKFEKVSNGKERFELLAISNQKQLLESLIEKLKYWEDMS